MVKFLLNPFASVIKNGMFHNWRGMIFGKNKAMNVYQLKYVDSINSYN